MSGDRKRQLRLQRTVFPSSGVLDVTSGVNLPPVKSGSCHMLSNPTAPCLGFPISNMRALVVPGSRVAARLMGSDSACECLGGGGGQAPSAARAPTAIRSRKPAPLLHPGLQRVTTPTY